MTIPPPETTAMQGRLIHAGDCPVNCPLMDASVHSSRQSPLCLDSESALLHGSGTHIDPGIPQLKRASLTPESVSIGSKHQRRRFVYA